MDTEKPPIVSDYSDYRKYLRDYYAFMKKTTTFFSHRYFMAKAGMRSPNFLKNVMEGRKDLSKDSVLKFAHALCLTREQTDYFENMVFFDQSPTTDKKQYYYDRMRLFSKSIVRVTVRDDQSAYFAKWHHAVVRELVVTRRYHDNWARLGKDVYPPISAAAARKSVELLLRLGMIVRSADGAYCLTERNVTAGQHPAYVLWIRQHHRQSLQNAMQAIDSVKPDRRSVSSLVMSVNERTYRDIEDEARQFRNRVSLLANSTKGADRVYQMAIQLFPVSSVRTGEARE